MRSATFELYAAELAVIYEPTRTGPSELLAALKEAGYGGEAGPGHGAYQPHRPFPEGADVIWISKNGEDVDLEAHEVPGKVTVFDFWAPWCEPCRLLDDVLAGIVVDGSGISLRKLNIVDWESPVARHYLVGVSQLPYVVVHSTMGDRVDEIVGLDVDRLRRAIEAGRSR